MVHTQVVIAVIASTRQWRFHRAIPMRSALLLLLPLVVATVALADTPPPSKPSADEARRFSDALKRGRKLSAGGNLDGALAALREALTVCPEEPRALDELGVVAWRKKDLPLAEKSLRRAIEVQPDVRKRAAALYNLGRVLEERGATRDAVDAYTRSLHDRPNKVVRERLATLDPAAAGSLDPLTPKPMSGPLASLKAFCGREHAECRRDDDDTDDEGKPRPPLGWSCKVHDKLTAAAPFLAAQLIDTACSDPDRDRQDLERTLAVQLADGWYFFSVGEAHESARQMESLSSSARLEPVVAGGPPRIVVRAQNESAYRGMNASATTRMTIAGVGPSGKPAATAPFIVVSDQDEDDEETFETKAHHHGELPVRFLADDTVELGQPINKKGRPFDPDTLGALVGKHKLAFP
jgi:tetratricopeptide (TPR) repeat protein